MNGEEAALETLSTVLREKERRDDEVTYRINVVLVCLVGNCNYKILWTSSITG